MFLILLWVLTGSPECFNEFMTGLEGNLTALVKADIYLQWYSNPQQ